ncbi:hypothetical protein H1C71_033618, partial [Ictidomys tridecemlineatus]
PRVVAGGWEPRSAGSRSAANPARAPLLPPVAAATAPRERAERGCACREEPWAQCAHPPGAPLPASLLDCHSLTGGVDTPPRPPPGTPPSASKKSAGSAPTDRKRFLATLRSGVSPVRLQGSVQTPTQ